MRTETILELPDARKCTFCGSKAVVGSTVCLECAHSVSLSASLITGSPTTSSGKTILAVDDDELNLELIGAIVKPMGHRVVRCGSGAEALALLRTKGAVYDLVLLDLMLPDMTGFEVSNRIVADSQIAKVPVVFLTALKGALDGAVDSSKIDGLYKPFHRAQLADLVNRILSRS